MKPWIRPRLKAKGYSKGAKVIHMHQVWESMVSDNTYRPGEEGWMSICIFIKERIDRDENSN